VHIAKGIFAFFVLFVAVRHLNPTGILFDQGVALCLIVSASQVVVDYWRNHTTSFASVKDGAMTFLIIYAFVITIPTQADRSFSLKMLQHLGESHSGLSREEIAQFYTTDFVAHGGLERRLVEQQTSGTVVERNGRFTLTFIGRTVNYATRIACYTFSCQAESGGQAVARRAAR
jgi:hypothetical protein